MVLFGFYVKKTQGRLCRTGRQCKLWMFASYLSHDSRRRIIWQEQSFLFIMSCILSLTWICISSFYFAVLYFVLYWLKCPRNGRWLQVEYIYRHTVESSVSTSRSSSLKTCVTEREATTELSAAGQWRWYFNA